MTKAEWVGFKWVADIGVARVWKRVDIKDFRGRSSSEAEALLINVLAFFRRFTTSIIEYVVCLMYSLPTPA